MRDCFRVWFKLGVVHGPERMNERDVCAGRGSSVKLPLGLRAWPPLVLPILCASWHYFWCPLTSAELNLQDSHTSPLHTSWLLSQVDMAHKGHFQPSSLDWALRLILTWIFLVACGGSHPLQVMFWGHPGLPASVGTTQLHLAGEHLM